MRVITGKFTDESGNPLSNGRLCLQLSGDATALGSAQLSRTLTIIQLNSLGAIPANTKIWFNDEIVPTLNTCYTVSILAAGGGLVYGPELYLFEGNAPLDFSQLTLSLR